jgi:pilus assembly protein Flp/PilA
MPVMVGGMQNMVGGMQNMVGRFFRRQRGQGLIEYALIIVLVALVVVGILILLGPAIGSVFSSVLPHL